MHPVKLYAIRSTGFIRKLGGINEALSRPIIPHYAGLCAADTLFYQILHQMEITICPDVPSSALSFSPSSFLISYPDEGMGRNAKSEMMCPRFPEPLPLEHPIPSLKEALEKVRGAARRAQI